MELCSTPRDAMPPRVEGILSKTLSSSPCVRWILPARIRSPLKNDLAFVGDTSVQLRGFISKGDPHLAEATCKLDLDVTILAATVISSEIETVPTLDQTIHQTVEDEKFTINGRPVSADEPPQVLVLSTSSCELFFLYVQEAHDGSLRFVYAKRPLLSGTDLGQQLGIHLARDPESRALAVAPGNGHFTICALRPFDQIRTEITKWRPNRMEPFKPWVEQRFVQIDGTVVRMDFLHSPKDEPEKVILVLLVAKHGRTFLLLYRWDSRLPLLKMRPMRSSGLELPREDGVPLMLIPCTATASFLLVTETEFVLYNRVMHSAAKRTAYEFQDPGGFQGSRRIKLWTQWGRPRRHSGYRKKSDEIILVREDGYMATYEINVQMDVKVTFASSPGNLGFSIDTAFSFLAAPLHIGGGDILVAGGSMAGGGVYHLPPTHGPRRIQAISNGAPFSDVILLPPNASERRGPVQQVPSMYSCCGGTEGRGSLAEIKIGLEAETGWTLDHPDVGSILRIWTLEAEEINMLLFVGSHGGHTSLVTLKLEKTELEYTDGAMFPGIDLLSPTLASATIVNDIMVQVTTTGLNVISLAGHFDAKTRSFGETDLICADIIPFSCMAAVAYKSRDSFLLSVLDIRTTSRHAAEISQTDLTYALSHRPTSISATTFLDHTAVIVTTADGEFELLLLSEEGRLTPTLSLNFADLDASLSATSVTSCCFLTITGSRTGLVLCGLKSGHLLCLEVRATKRNGNGHHVACRIVSNVHLALTAVTVTVDEYSRRGDTYDKAFIAFENFLETLSLRPNEAGAEFDRCRVLVRNREKPSLPQEPINAVSRVPHLSSAHGAGVQGLLIYVTLEDFSFASMLGQSKATLRHIDMPGMPRRVVLSNFLNKFVIGVDPISPTLSGQQVTPEQAMSTVPRLFFAPLDDRLPIQTSLDVEASVVLGAPGESISALVHYSPSDDVCHYEMTLAALRSCTRLDSGAFKICSRIVSVSDKHVLRSPGDTTARNVMRLPGKNITALCPIGKSGLLIASSNELLLHNLDVKTKRWATLTRHALPSPAKEIRVRGSVIFIATEKHSLLLLRLSDDTLSMYGSDTRARTVNHVVPIDKYRMMLADKTSRGTTFTGFYEAAIGTWERTFEITVPASIESVVQDKRRSAGDHHDSFVASAIDGTIYSLSILTTDQWLLCYFLQGLCDPTKTTQTKRKAGVQMLDLRLLMHQQKIGVTSAMLGIDGNLLGSMLEPGPYCLRGLLEPAVKTERDDLDRSSRNGADEVKAKMSILQELVVNVMGPVEEDYLVESVMLWLRALLQN